MQCNTFDNMPGLTLTTGGGRRSLPLLNQEEDVAMIGVHYEGKFVEIVPWKGSVEVSNSMWFDCCDASPCPLTPFGCLPSSNHIKLRITVGGQPVGILAHPWIHRPLPC